MKIGIIIGIIAAVVVSASLFFISASEPVTREDILETSTSIIAQDIVYP